MNSNRAMIITGNAKIVIAINQVMILSMIREIQLISRVNVARNTGLNKSTVSSIISELLKEDLIYELVNEDQNIGRNLFNLFIKLGKYFIGAVDIDSSIKAIDPRVVFIEVKITDAWDLGYPDMQYVSAKCAFGERGMDMNILRTSIKDILPRLMGATTLAIKEIFDGFKIT